MASVARCPRCSHELVVPDDTDLSAWAKCTACNNFFQVKDASAREVANLVLVDTGTLPAVVDEPAATLPMRDVVRQIGPTRTVTMSSAKTLEDSDSPGDGQEVALLAATSGEAENGDVGAPPEKSKHSSLTIADFSPSSAATWEETPTEPRRCLEPAITERIVRVTDDPPSVPAPSVAGVPETASATPDQETDVPANAPAARPDATIEFSEDLPISADADFELEPSTGSPTVVSSWDDSEHMERLLAGDGDQHGEDAPPEDDSDNELYVRVAPSYMPSGKRRRRRRPSIVRTLVGMAVAGVIGTAIGYYILLVASGPSGDFLDVAQYLPSAILPGSFAPKTFVAGKEPIVAGEVPEQQASFNAPSATGNTEPEEPHTFTPTEVEPIGDVGAPRVSGAPTYTSDELAAALQTAKDAKAGLMTGSLADGDAVQRRKGNSFSVLCDLAEKATFDDVDSVDAPLAQEADVLFREALSDARIRGEVGRIVPLWIASKHRKNGGVFFAGTISDPTTRGQLVECRIELDEGVPLTLIIPASMASELDKSSRPVGVVGSLVDRPVDTISGYDGEASQVVWVGRLIELD